jgi:hypothetical protein
MKVFMLRAVLLWLVAAAVMPAQQGQGVIYGTVTDPSGAPVAGAPVTVTNTDTNVSTNAVTGEQGDYVTPNIAVGSYRVSVSQPGFKALVRSGIVLQVGQRAEVNLHLAVGEVSEKVEVTGNAPLVDTSGATIGNVIENKRISELPLNGRNVLALMFLAPNVKSQAGPTNSGFVDRGTAMSSVSINGGPSSINNFLLDGGNNNQSFLQDLNMNPTVDAIQEFKVQSGVMSSEYGFTAGGVVNIVTKSGTNEFHGTAYEFIRNDAIDARNAFSPTKAPLRYNQYGGALGGPLWFPKIYDGRNRTFFFFNLERWKYTQGSNPFGTVLTPQERTGDFSDLGDKNGKLVPIYDPATTQTNPKGPGFVRSVFPNNLIPANRLDPVSMNFMPFYPLPNRTPDNPYTHQNNYIASIADNRHMEQYVVRLDHHFSEKNSAFFRYMYFNHFNDNGTATILPDPIVRDRYDNLEARNAIIGDTHTFTPTLFNEFRLDLARNYFPFRSASYGLGLVRKLGLPDTVPDVELPTISNGLPNIPGNSSVGTRGQTTWQLFDAVTWVLGPHTLKMGTDIRLQQANNYQPSNPSGTFSFAAALTGDPLNPSGTGYSPATFLLGAVSSASVATYLGESEEGWSASGFIQDDWRITRRFTWNWGLRYDYQPWPVERNNGLSNFNPWAINPVNGLRGDVGYAGIDFGRSPLGRVPLEFSPRAGFAWDVFGTSKTVVRGGYGIYYPDIFYRDIFGNTAGFASTTTSYTPAGGNSNFPAFQFSNGFPTYPTQPLGAALGPSAFLGQGVSYDQNDAAMPESQQWDFSIQQQLPGNWMVEADYTGNHATHLVAGGYDMNQLNPAYLTLGNALQNNVPNPYAGIVPGSLGGATIIQSQALKQFPYYTSVNVRNPHMGDSIYHAGLLSVQKRFTNGLVLLASYTKAKLISDSVAVPVNFDVVDSSVNVNGYQNGAYNRRAERSVDPTDVAQRLVISGVYEIPVGRGKLLNVDNRFLNAIVGGWQTQGILTIQSGLPLVITGANNHLANRPNSTGQSAKLSDPTQYEWFNTAAFVNPPDYTYGNAPRTLPDVRGPGTVNLDLSLIKNFNLWERLSLQFRAESFNLANHVNLGMPNTSFVAGPNGQNTSATFGTITSAGSARVNQFGVKVIF